MAIPCYLAGYPAVALFGFLFAKEKLQVPIIGHPTHPLAYQKLGTLGLCKKVRVCERPGYAENFLQSIFDVVAHPDGGDLVIGGDGRYHNRLVIQQAIRIE